MRTMQELMEVITLEQIDKILEYPTIKNIAKVGDEYFKRWRHFTVGEHQYRIEWWKNVSYIHCPGNVIVPFHRMRVTNTWPNHSKMNLQFEYGNTDTCCIIKIDG